MFTPFRIIGRINWVQKTRKVLKKVWRIDAWGAENRNILVLRWNWTTLVLVWAAHRPWSCRLKADWFLPLKIRDETRISRVQQTWSCDTISVNSPPGEGNWATRGLVLFVPFSTPSGESIDSELWLLHAYLDGWRNLCRFYLWMIVGCSSVTDGRSIDALSWSWIRRRRARRLNNVEFKDRTWVIYNELSRVIDIETCDSNK